jgi:hypothetical protein
MISYLGDLGSSAAAGIVVVVLLIVLLVEREVLRAAGGAQATARMRALTVASLPLLVTALAVMATRLANING